MEATDATEKLKQILDSLDDYEAHIALAVLTLAIAEIGVYSFGGDVSEKFYNTADKLLRQGVLKIQQAIKEKSDGAEKH